MAKNKTRRSRFDGIDLTTLNQEAAKVTGQPSVEKNIKEDFKLGIKEDVKKEVKLDEKDGISLTKRGKGRPKSSSRKPLNTAIEPNNRQRLEFLAMLNGGSVADQLNNILDHYFTKVEKVDELIKVFEQRKKKNL